jgi:glycosyltransferase involved in cell wall biosynthesis
MLFALIPCYNAETTLPQLFTELAPFISKARTICIDDGSRDSTPTLLQNTGALVHCFPKNQGKGVCLKMGYELAVTQGASSVLALDSDMQHLPTDIPKFLDAAKHFDIVIGSRRRNGHFTSPMPAPRIFSNTTTSNILTRLTGQKIWDAQCGFRLIQRPCFERIAPRCHETGFMFETEFLLNAAKEKFKIGFVEIEVIYGSQKSNMRYVKDTFNFIKLVLRQI